MQDIPVYPLDKQIKVVIEIIKTLASESVTFGEFTFINDLVNDIVKCQKEHLEYPDLYHFQNRIKAADTKDIVIRYEDSY